MEESKQCPKCNGKMIKGVIPDVTYGGYKLSKWAESVSGVFFPKVVNPKHIDSYRCKQCGFLENYALQ